MIQLTIAWTCVGIFIATAVITLLALVGVIKLAERRYLRRLFSVLIVEVCAACVGMFTGHIELPGAVEERVEDRGREKALSEAAPKIEALNQEIAAREAKVQQYLKRIPPDQISAADRAALEKPLRLDPKALRLQRPR